MSVSSPANSATTSITINSKVGYGTDFQSEKSPLICKKGAKCDHDDHSCGHEHTSHRAPWLRACVLGANDGLVSVSCLILGIIAGGQSTGAVISAELRKTIILTGLSGLVAGSLSMAVGEYISVSSQRDAEEADIEMERNEHMKGPAAIQKELDELTQIYIDRGLNPQLARTVAIELSENDDPVRVHARDELGIDMDELANPVQAALMSAVSFCIGAIVPVIPTFFITSHLWLILAVLIVSAIALMAFGAFGAVLGGASKIKGGLRVLVGGGLAMGITFGIGKIFNIFIGQ